MARAEDSGVAGCCGAVAWACAPTVFCPRLMILTKGFIAMMLSRSLTCYYCFYLYNAQRGANMNHDGKFIFGATILGSGSFSLLNSLAFLENTSMTLDNRRALAH
jgi:hypothetical protein